MGRDKEVVVVAEVAVVVVGHSMMVHRPEHRWRDIRSRTDLRYVSLHFLREK